MRLSLVSLAAACLSTAAFSATAQTSPPPPAVAAAVKPVDAAERKAVIEDLANMLEEAFVFPEVGAKYAAMLRANLAAGTYDALTDPDAFGDKVTADIQAVSPDGHLRLRTAEAYASRKPSAPVTTARSAQADPSVRGLEETKMIGAVAYLRFNEFPDANDSGAKARQFLLDHPSARAVIIDARPNRGGGLGVMNAMLPLLYAKPTVLVRMDTRASAVDNTDPPYPSLIRRPSPSSVVRFDHQITPDATERRLQSVPVYYLTSKRTASAAEHLALAFKRTKRAVLIGETTRGAGHFGGVQPVGERFAAFIPIGRTYDPDTGWDWEGKGVAPDVAVPADEALDKALALAKAAGVETGQP
ncbi:MAG: S41 family peptidase [Caulobacteraceae bacterium]